MATRVVAPIAAIISVASAIIAVRAARSARQARNAAREVAGFPSPVIHVASPLTPEATAALREDLRKWAQMARQHAR